MGILFKITFLIYLFSLSMHSAYIRNVVVNHNGEPTIEKELINRFKGSFSNEQQIDFFVSKLKQRGVFQMITYQLLDVENGEELVFNVKYNQKIDKINFLNLPISDQKLIAKLKNKVGGYFSYSHLSQDIEIINNELIEQGYFLASVLSIRLNDDGELIINIESPTLWDIDFQGLGSIPDWYVRRDLVLQKNKLINQNLLDIDFNTLQSLPLFSNVSLPNVQFVSSENVLISYKVKPKKSNRFDFGIEELENNQGVALFTKVKRYNNLIFSDLLELQAQLSYLNNVDVRSYQLHYQQPWLFNRFSIALDSNIYAKYRSEVFQQDLDVYNTIRTGASVFFSKQNRLLKLNYGSGLRYERVSPQNKGDFQSYDNRTIGFFVEQNKINNFINPRFGHRSKLMYDLGGDVLGLNLGGVNFYRLSLMHSRYHSLFRSQIFAWRIFSGFYKKDSTISTFETEKFSLGGSNSLRGYQEFAMYGNYRFSFNLEDRFIIDKGLLFVLFYDGGFINDSMDALFNQYYQGVGFGFRWLSTFMPIRLDFAYGDDFMIHLSLSQTF